MHRETPSDQTVLFLLKNLVPGGSAAVLVGSLHVLACRLYLFPTVAISAAQYRTSISSMSSSDQDGRTASELVLDLSSPSLVLDHTQSRWVQKLAVCSVESLQVRFRTFIGARVLEPVACSFSNDPTPMTVRHRVRMNLDNLTAHLWTFYIADRWNNIRASAQLKLGLATL